VADKRGLLFLLAGAIVTAGGLLAPVLYRGATIESGTALPDRPGTIERAPA